jgi:hypothetical protein
MAVSAAAAWRRRGDGTGVQLHRVGHGGPHGLPGSGSDDGGDDIGKATPHWMWARVGTLKPVHPALQWDLIYGAIGAH